MSIRSWQANPSQQIELDGKVWPVVSQDDLIKALLDGAIMLDRAGGCLQVVLQRVPTPLPNEMVTVAAIVVWQDRTNAKPQPESQGPEVVDGAELPDERALSNDELAAVVAGTDAPDELPDVDESAVPEPLRG